MWQHGFLGKGFSLWGHGFLDVGFSAWLCWWWCSWVSVAMMVVDVSGSGYGFVSVGGGGLLIGLWMVSIVPLF